VPLIPIIPIGNSLTCSFNSEGTLTFPQRVIDLLGWEHNAKIALSYIHEPLTLLLRSAEIGHPGFTLSHLSHADTGKAGGKISCTKFSKEVLRSRIVFPLRGLVPIFLKSSNFQLALTLQSPEWRTVEFSLTGCQKISPEVKGVYQLLSSDMKVLRIGEGIVQTRTREHLKDQRIVQSTQLVRYISLEDKEETEIMEKILIAYHEAEHKHLPEFNSIRA